MYIHNVTFSNFYSFYEESYIDFLTTKNKASATTDFDCNRYVNKISGIFGSNGSGKTNALKAIAFICDFATMSFDSKHKGKIFYEPHELHEDEPSVFKIEFSQDETLFRYEFTCNSRTLESESLHYLNKDTGKFNYIYKRSKNNGKLAIKLSGNGTIPSVYDRFEKDNCSLLSFVKATTDDDVFVEEYPLLSKAIIAFQRTYINVGPEGKIDNTHYALINISEYLSKTDSPVILKFIEEVIRNIDLGISGLSIEESKIVSGESYKEQKLLYATHVDVDGNDYKFPIFKESTGTQKIICALWQMIRAMWIGGVVVYDEIDSDLHTYMMPFFIDIFSNPEININKGQLIFSGHTIDSIKDLSKSQTFFTEKVDLRSEIFRVSDIEGLRANENIYMKYKKGALGGIPDLDASNISLKKIIKEIELEEK